MSSIANINRYIHIKRYTGLEPVPTPWKGGMLPLTPKSHAKDKAGLSAPATWDRHPKNIY